MWLVCLLLSFLAQSRGFPESTEEIQHRHQSTVDIIDVADFLNQTKNYSDCISSNSISTECKEDNDSSPNSSETLAAFPFSLSIRRRGACYANGALLNNEWVISSAAEFYNVRESIRFYSIRVGSIDCKRGGVVKPIKQVEIHPFFVPGSPSYDLALLRMATPINYTSAIQPINLSPIRAKVVNARFIVTYWPRLIVNGVPLSRNAVERIRHRNMRKSLQMLQQWTDCYNEMKSNNVDLSETSICLKPISQHHSVCLPDAGAPVIGTDGLWGVTSGWTPSHCQYTSSVVVTRTSSPEVRYWIADLVG